MTKPNKPAFPFSIYGDKAEIYHGLSKREYFAAKAMQGMISSHTTLEGFAELSIKEEREGVELISEASVKQADALLKELEK